MALLGTARWQHRWCPLHLLVVISLVVVHRVGQAATGVLPEDA